MASIVPQAVPLQPEPGAPLLTLQVKVELFEALTAAVNRNWLGTELDGGRNALAGEITMLVEEPPVPTILICALALLDESALLVAVSSAGFVEGTTEGARKSTVAVLGPTGGTHGLEFVMQTVPICALPLTMPFTDHTTD